MEKLAGGFFNISGGAVSPAGDFYFVDAHWQRIYRWSAARGHSRRSATVLLDPVNLAFDQAGNLMVVSYAGNGTVYALKPGAPDDGDMTLLKPAPVVQRPSLRAILPTGSWRLNASNVPAAGLAVPSPDGTTFIPAGQDFVSGAVAWNVKTSALLRAFGLAPAVAGKPFYITEEAEVKTWVGTVQPDGSLVDLKVFVNQGGESVTTDAHGKVYIAAGQVYVYQPSGRLVETIEVPERPLQVMFGGRDGQTLFIPARTSLYAVRTRVVGL